MSEGGRHGELPGKEGGWKIEDGTISVGEISMGHE